jgi:hypothetical protein
MPGGHNNDPNPTPTCLHRAPAGLCKPNRLSHIPSFGTPGPDVACQEATTSTPIQHQHAYTVPLRGFANPTDRATFRVSGHRSLMLYARRPQHLPQSNTNMSTPCPCGAVNTTDRANFRVSGHGGLMLYARRPQQRPQSNTNMPAPCPCGALQTQPTEPHSEFRVTGA